MFKRYQEIDLFPDFVSGMKPLQLWKAYLKKLKGLYGIGFLAVVFTNASQVLEPKLLQWAIESFEAGEPQILRYTWLLLGLYFFQVLSRHLWRVTMAQQSHVTSASMKSRLWEHVRHLPIDRTQRDLNTGELMNVATGDISHAKFIFGFTLVGTIDFFFMILLTSVTMLLIDVKLTLISLSVILLLPFLIHRIAKKEEILHKKAQESLSFLSDEISQAVSTVRLQKLSLTQKFWFKRLSQAARSYQQKRWKLLKTDLSFIPATGFAPIVSVAVLMLLSIPRLMEGSLSLGAFVALSSLAYMIADPLMELGWIVSEWQLSLTSLGRVTHVLDQKREPHLYAPRKRIDCQNYSLQAKNLKFQYPHSDRVILNNVDLRLASGERLGVKGGVGVGKSTFLEVLAGFHPTYNGVVKIAGHDIKNYSQKQLREFLSFVPQRAFLFADSIAKNISMDQDLSEEEIWHFLSLAELKTDIEKFPMGIQSSLGEWGVNLSGGQKQRMTIARALARRPKILFLDDCLSAVDTVTEEKILKNLDRHFGNTTVLWAAHRESTLKYCGRVMEL